MNLVADRAKAMGFERLIGEYRATKKNSMVKEHYRKLGFHLLGEPSEESTIWEMRLRDYSPFSTPISTVESKTHG
jgi:predicted enzyme involved in methoxymalonyl-ACP biosynthesis